MVSDWPSAVVVTDHEGRHRFSYNGHPPGSVLLWLCDICTDAMSHILVCDEWSKTVHMLDKDGQFLSCLLTKSQEIAEPHSLGYDVNTHLLWVGSRDNKLSVYKYIDRKVAIKGNFNYFHQQVCCYLKNHFHRLAFIFQTVQKIDY